jgi:heme exporter protein C
VKLTALTTVLFGAAGALIFFYAPTDGDQGFSQRIFYFHVPIALTSYACFGWGAWKALRYLRTRDERAGAYFMLRFSVDPGPARANMSAVYALFGVVLIPVSFLAIRLSQRFIHPVVFNSHGPQMTGSQFFTFCVALAAMLALFATLYSVELTGKRIDAHLRELRELLT